MSNRFDKCHKCPAYHLLTDERKEQIERWEYKRQQTIDRIKKIRLILIGESMPANRYFYDPESDYENGGMRYNIKEEFGQLELSDSLFMESLRRKGVVLYDCALCPLHKLDNNVDKRQAATYCFLAYNKNFVEENSDIPIATIFPSRRGWLKNEIPESIKSRVVKEFSFSNIKGLKDLYLSVKAKEK